MKIINYNKVITRGKMEFNNEQKFKLVGNLTKIIARSDNVSDALVEGMSFLTNFHFADYAFAWFKDYDDEKILRPYFSISPIDITSKYIKAGSGIVGASFVKNEPILIEDFKKYSKEKQNIEANSEIENTFESSMNIKSMMCAPLTINNVVVGCVQCILCSKEKQFTKDDLDILRLFCETMSYYLEDLKGISTTWKFPEIVLSAKNVTKEFKSKDITTKVLKGINIDIYKGEFVVLLGESGCGKTTLLNILGGLDSLTSGEILFKDKNLSNMNEDQLTKYRRNNIGFVFQNYHLMPNINVKQNIDLISELVDEPLDTLEVLDLVKLKEKKNNFPSQMSGGQQQRVSIARAIVKNPKIIMADEPTAALDYETSIEVLSVFEDIIKKGATLVMVTHNEEIAKMANRVVRFRNGQVYNIQINSKPVSASSLIW